MVFTRGQRAAQHGNHRILLRSQALASLRGLDIGDEELKKEVLACVNLLESGLCEDDLNVMNWSSAGNGMVYDEDGNTHTLPDMVIGRLQAIAGTLEDDNDQIHAVQVKLCVCDLNIAHVL